MIRRILEFPTLKKPALAALGQKRMRKRRFILYSLCLSSVVIVWRLLMLLRSYLTLDLRNFEVINVTYNTKEYNRVLFEVQLKDSYSPLNISIDDIVISMFSFDGSGSERFMLSVKASMIDITKNKKLAFTGDLQIGTVDKKGLISGRHMTEFSLKLEAKIRPRLCFVRFPLSSSTKFNLKNPLTGPSGGAHFEKIVFRKTMDGLEVMLDVDNGYLDVPSFLSVQSSSMCVHFEEKSIIDGVLISKIDIRKGVICERISMMFEIQECGGELLRNNIIRMLRNKEVDFVVESISFEDQSRTIELGIKVGFNSRILEDYDFPVVCGGRTRTGPTISILPAPFIGSALRARLRINKRFFPFVAESTPVVFSDFSFLFNLSVDGAMVAIFSFTPEDGDRCIDLDCRCEFGKVEQLVGMLYGGRDGRFVLTSAQDRGSHDIFFRDTVLSYVPGKLIEFSHLDETYCYPCVPDKALRNELEIFHGFTEGVGDSKLRIKSTVGLLPVHPEISYSVEMEIPAFSILVKSERSQLCISVKKSAMKWARGERLWSKAIHGRLEMVTDFTVFVFNESATSIRSALFGNNIQVMAPHAELFKIDFTDRSARPESSGFDGDMGKIAFKYQGLEQLGRHVISLGIHPPLKPRTASWTIRNTLDFPMMEFCLCSPCEGSGPVPRHSIRYLCRNNKEWDIFMTASNGRLSYNARATGSYFMTHDDLSIEVEMERLRGLRTLFSGNMRFVPRNTGRFVPALFSNLLNFALYNGPSGPKKALLERSVKVESKLTRTSQARFEGYTSLSIPEDVLRSSLLLVEFPDVELEVRPLNLNCHGRPIHIRLAERNGTDLVLSYDLDTEAFLASGASFVLDLRINGEHLVRHMDAETIRKRILDAKRILFEEVFTCGGKSGPEIRVFHENGMAQDGNRYCLLNKRAEVRNSIIGKLLFTLIPKFFLKFPFSSIPGGLKCDLDFSRCLNIGLSSPKPNSFVQDLHPQADGLYEILAVELSVLKATKVVQYDFTGLVEAEEQPEDGVPSVILCPPGTSPVPRADELDVDLHVFFSLELEIKNHGALSLSELKPVSPLLQMLTFFSGRSSKIHWWMWLFRLTSLSHIRISLPLRLSLIPKTSLMLQVEALMSSDEDKPLFAITLPGSTDSEGNYEPLFLFQGRYSEDKKVPGHPGKPSKASRCDVSYTLSSSHGSARRYENSVEFSIFVIGCRYLYNFAYAVFCLVSKLPWVFFELF
jgi:hypothetical protein